MITILLQIIEVFNACVEFRARLKILLISDV